MALAIFAGTVSAVMLTLSNSRTNVARAGVQLRAELAAEALLARIGLDIPLQPQKASGHLPDGSAWNILIHPITSQVKSSGGKEIKSASLLAIEVKVVAAGNYAASVRLSTIMSTDLSQ